LRPPLFLFPVAGTQFGVGYPLSQLLPRDVLLRAFFSSVSLLESFPSVGTPSARCGETEISFPTGTFFFFPPRPRPNSLIFFFPARPSFWRNQTFSPQALRTSPHGFPPLHKLSPSEFSSKVAWILGRNADAVYEERLRRTSPSPQKAPETPLFSSVYWCHGRSLLYLRPIEVSSCPCGK